MSRKKSPYPHRGTPLGDQLVGRCEAMGCALELRRGDTFVTLVGDVLICGECNRNGFKLKERAMK